MAAKEKSQQAKVAPAPTVDLLMDFDAPSTEKDPPPSYDTNFLAGVPPPAVDAPPAFDAVESNVMNQVQQQQLNIMDFPPPPPIDSVMPPPPPMGDILPPPPDDPMMMMMAPSAPAASAPSFEDLLGGTMQQPSELHPPPLPPPVEGPAAIDIDDSILNALDPAEREAFLEEQRKIMEQIEKEKKGSEMSGAAARAAAFDQRSSAAVAQVAASYEGGGRSRAKKSSNRSSTSTYSHGGTTVNLGEGNEVPLHGQEKTQKAIEDGTAVIVQCLSCSNWMQVTGEAEVMFCPICQTVCHVEKTGAATTADMEAAAQLAADAELAEKLQKEEYSRAGGGGGSTRRRQARAPAPASAPSSAGQSWYDWLVGAPAPAPAAASSNSHSAEIRPQRGLVPATTGEEGGVGRSRSYDESERLMGGGGGGARVAQQKSMFACVADSITDAANQMTSFTLSEDPEGNVHGVDSSSLLAMPDVSRRRDNDST